MDIWPDRGDTNRSLTQNQTHSNPLSYPPVGHSCICLSTQRRQSKGVKGGNRGATDPFECHGIFNAICLICCWRCCCLVGLSWFVADFVSHLVIIEFFYTILPNVQGGWQRWFTLAAAITNCHSKLSGFRVLIEIVCSLGSPNPQTSWQTHYL